MAVPWSYITLMIDYGYFGRLRIEISCTNEGKLHFKELLINWKVDVNRISDTSQTLDEKELTELDRCVTKLMAVKKIERSMVLDGGSFEISVAQKDGKIRKLYCYHSFQQRNLDQALSKMRKLLKEDYFLKKYESELSRF